MHAQLSDQQAGRRGKFAYVAVIASRKETFLAKRSFSRTLAALLLAYQKGNGGLCRSLVKDGAVLGSFNHAGISIFNCQVLI